ncbi:Uncharacterised protein [Salmonella enterica subsp. indica]|uniref:Uncharacterized protein n=1 Tax=Salmonella enterica subsp. indica TaxID=59207 RepID=A0A379XJE6_SALER|nr:Uncharacterised protein [Salmonella enterica subsp. indica]
MPNDSGRLLTYAALSPVYFCDKSLNISAMLTLSSLLRDCSSAEISSIASTAQSGSSKSELVNSKNIARSTIILTSFTSLFFNNFHLYIFDSQFIEHLLCTICLSLIWYFPTTCHFVIFQRVGLSYCLIFSFLSCNYRYLPVYHYISINPIKTYRSIIIFCIGSIYGWCLAFLGMDI